MRTIETIKQLVNCREQSMTRVILHLHAPALCTSSLGTNSRESISPQPVKSSYHWPAFKCFSKSRARKSTHTSWLKKLRRVCFIPISRVYLWQFIMLSTIVNVDSAYSILKTMRKARVSIDNTSGRAPEALESFQWYFWSFFYTFHSYFLCSIDDNWQSKNPVLRKLLKNHKPATKIFF
jgi:hypothetical protein